MCHDRPVAVSVQPAGVPLHAAHLGSGAVAGYRAGGCRAGALAVSLDVLLNSGGTCNLLSACSAGSAGSAGSAAMGSKSQPVGACSGVGGRGSR